MRAALALAAPAPRWRVLELAIDKAAGADDRVDERVQAVVISEVARLHRERRSGVALRVALEAAPGAADVQQVILSDEVEVRAAADRVRRQVAAIGRGAARAYCSRLDLVSWIGNRPSGRAAVSR